MPCCLQSRETAFYFFNLQKSDTNVTGWLVSTAWCSHAEEGSDVQSDWLRLKVVKQAREAVTEAGLRPGTDPTGALLLNNLTLCA